MTEQLSVNKQWKRPERRASDCILCHANDPVHWVLSIKQFLTKNFIINETPTLFP